MKLKHPTHVEIDLDRLHGNLDLIWGVAKVPLLPVVKADAYGHGAIPIAREMVKRDDIVAALCAGTVDEGVELRRAGIGGRIIVLDGVLREQAADVARNDLEAVVSSETEARHLASKTARGRVKVHVKINTGMTRLGAEADEAVAMYRKIAGMKRVEISGLMTHFADSGEKHGMTAAQISRFDEAVSAIRASGQSLPPLHAANTAAIFLHARSRYDLVRPGIGVYGVQEFGGRDVGLKPVLSWRARVMMVRAVARGTPVSYGMTWISPGRREVAVVCAGYADGYSRLLSNKARGIFKGKIIRQAGTICMDSCLFDVTGLGVNSGDTVTLIGEDGGEMIKAVDLARWQGTIAYEVLCGIGRRAPRVYLRRGRIMKTPR